MTARPTHADRSRKITTTSRQIRHMACETPPVATLALPTLPDRARASFDVCQVSRTPRPRKQPRCRADGASHANEHLHRCRSHIGCEPASRRRFLNLACAEALNLATSGPGIRQAGEPSVTDARIGGRAATGVPRITAGPVFAASTNRTPPAYCPDTLRPRPSQTGPVFSQNRRSVGGWNRAAACRPTSNPARFNCVSSWPSE